MSYEGPERRREASTERANRIGEWLLDRAGVIAGAVVVIYLALAVISVAVVSTNRRAKDQLERVESLVSSVETLSKDNRATLELLENCLTPGRPCSEALADQAKVNREAIVRAIGCVLLETPEARTEASVERCFQRYLPGGEGKK